MDKIILHHCTFYCYIGVPNSERKSKQKILVDIELFFSIKKATKTNKITDTINYDDVHSTIKRIVQGKKHILVETLTKEIAQSILQSFPIKKVMVRVWKPAAMKRKRVKNVAVEILRNNKI